MGQKPVTQRRRSPKIGASAATIAAALALTPTLAFAGAEVHGTPDAVSIDAKNTSVEEILAALGQSFDVHIRTSANLDKHLTGTYEGTLPQVVSRVLEGYNFIVRTGKGHLDVNVLGSGRSTTVAAQPAGTPAAHTASTVPARPAAPPAAAVAPAAAAADGKAPAASPARNIAKEQTGPDSPPIIKVAEGPTPPMPVPGAASGPVPMATPSNVAAPMPVLPPPGAEPIKGPEPTKSTVEPPQFRAMAKPGDAAPPMPKATTSAPAPGGTNGAAPTPSPSPKK